MDEFNYLLTLFGLLLGLALAEGLGGLANALNVRGTVKIGWPTALLGLYVSCNVATFWINGWALRELLPVTWPVVFTGFVITALTYVSASLIFPKHADAWADVDAHFERHRRTVMGGMLAANLAMLGTLQLFKGLPEFFSLRMIVIIWSAYPAGLVVMFARRRALVLGALGWLVAIYPLSVAWRLVAG